jgi:uncharacterized Fe-S cluster-containing radical SAM superfamily protein
VNSQNLKTATVRSVTGVLGTHRRPSGRYRATLWYGGKSYHLGTFDTPEEAHAAYLEAKRLMHKGNTL